VAITLVAAALAANVLGEVNPMVLPDVERLLEVRNLSIDIKRKGNSFTAVNEIDIAINAGEIVALAGESGCGKTLTGLAIPRLLRSDKPITGGEIRYYNGSSAEYTDLCLLDEKSLCRIRGKEISIIFQESRQSLNPLMRIGAQIAEALVVHGLAGKKAAGKAALELLRTLRFPNPEETISAWPHQLSGGMCQRVMIAIAAICRPRLLIADEPTTALDEAIQGRILDLLGQVNREFGTAILFISHDLSLASRFCSRFLVMYAGRIVEEGPSQALFSEPAHPYTAGLIGAIPRRENRGKPLATIPGRVPSIEDQLPGCPFAPRCPKAQDRCGAALPPLANIGNGDGESLGHSRRVRCFFPEARNG
jgi:oligopeptide/dipeptide ABC transporter ATP-binding protein